MNIKNYKFYKKLLELSFIKEIWLFGSRSRGDNQERADIDLAILCNNASFEDWLLVRSIIEDADTLLKIDCIRMDGLPETSDLKISIIQQGIRLYEKR
jgi:predicted nucleotidyltransferase